MATVIKGKTFVNGELVTPAKIHELVDLATVTNIQTADISDAAITSAKIANGTIVNDDISASAAITDTKLAQIATAGKVANSATTANSTNTPNAIVARDASGNFAAGTITANLTGNVAGNASTATKLATARTINVSGDVTGTAQSFDGSANISIPTAITAGSIVNADINSAAAISDTKLATISAAGKVLNSATTATNENTPNTIVARDASGNFAAGTVTANLTGNVTGAVTGNAGTATKLATARTISLTGDVTGSVSFDGSANATLTAAVADDSHNHTIANIDNLQTALDGKQAAGSYAAANHTHDERYYTESEVNTLLAGKQNNLGFTPVQQGGGVGQGTNKIYLGWSAGGLKLQVDATDFGLDWPIKLSNDKTTATSNNTPNTIIARDNYGGAKINWVEALSPGNNSGIYSIYNNSSNYIGGILSNGTNTGVIYSTASDYRLKTDLEKLTGALARLSALPVHRFKWVGHPAAPKVDGFLAHEAQAVVPESVTGTKDAVDADGKPIYQGIDQSKLVPLLVAAVQELAARVAALEAK